jgi:hypothetical protein
MRRDAEARRRKGIGNAVSIVANPGPLPPLRLPEDYPEDYHDWPEIKSQRDAEVRPWAKPSAEWRDGGWYDMNSDKRVYSQNEKLEAIRLYHNGYSAGVVGAMFGTSPATIRQWAKRERDRDTNARLPRFAAA